MAGREKKGWLAQQGKKTRGPLTSTLFPVPGARRFFAYMNSIGVSIRPSGFS